jgi:exodeoxyribonuclease V alpha subunit
VDEASMIDTELMVALLNALKPGTRIVLLGDRDQLPSVGVGQLVHDLCEQLGQRNSDHALPYSSEQCALLGRLCGFPLDRWCRKQPDSAIGNCLALLQHSYRFEPASAIGRLAELVNTGDSAGIAAFMRAKDAEQGGDVSVIAPDAFKSEWLDRLAQPWLLLQRVFEHGETPIADKLSALGSYRVLCAVRTGSGSVALINRHIEQKLAHRTPQLRQGYYAGKPIMITENDYSLHLYNGDSGLVLEDEDGQLAAWFDGIDGMPRRFSISRLPAHETSYAISVHKSQGSEYRHVALVLPPADANSLTPLVTRELIYTAVTRAREQLTLACTIEALVEGIARRVRRDTGLAARLRADP